MTLDQDTPKGIFISNYSYFCYIATFSDARQLSVSQSLLSTAYTTILILLGYEYFLDFVTFHLS